ncbi:quinon protein alcohol dehydrogenase-like superfamily [Melampsora americana]|nr:quinon protein alcohol dehydrogenase-like superfamily [Melampsora americana]
MSHYSINLGSPIYCTVFVDQDRIILGGGGGSSKSGISNKSWLIQLKPKNKDHLILHEYGLPSGSDSPMSIDLDRSIGLVLSGIDSSPTELKLGRNLHLRTFKLLRINCLSRASPQLLAVGGTAISTPISCPAGELLTVDFSEEGTHFLICSTQAVRIFSIIFPLGNQEKKEKKEKKEIKLKQSHELIPTQTYPSTSFRSTRKKGARVLSWNLNDGSLRRSRLISTRPVTAFDLSESGKLLALSSSDLTVSVIDALSLRPILTILHAHEFPVTCLKFSIDSSRLVSASADTTIQVIEIPERRSAWRSSALILIFLTILMIFIPFILNQNSLNLNSFLVQLFLKFNSFNL